MKTIFITSFHPLISRNILSTDIVPSIVSSGNVRVVVVVPNFKTEYFANTYGRPNVIIEGVEVGPSIRTRRVGLLKRLVEALPNTKRAAIGRRRNLSGEKKASFYYYLFYLPAGLCGKFFFMHKLFRTVDFFISPRGRFYALIRRYRPDCIFSTDVQNEHDVALMQDARRYGIKVISMVRSWDNLTTRALRVLPDMLLVHNEIIKREAKEIHGVPEERIAVVGIPHYDRYITRGPTLKRAEFLKTIHADPEKKVIMYIPVCDYRLHKNDVDGYVIETLASVNATIYVRFPPAETVDLSGFVKGANVIFDMPGYAFEGKTVGTREMTPEEDERFLNAIAACDCVVSGPSTVAIDAAFFDKPVVLVNFYPREISDDEKIYEYGAEHFSRILEAGGGRMAKSRDEFLRLIQEYLRNPELDHEGRARVVAEQCWRTDGKSSERVASLLLQRLGS